MTARAATDAQIVGPQRLGYLDGLRGVAAIIVLLSHYVLAFEPSLYLGGLNLYGQRIAGGPDAYTHWWITQTPFVCLFCPQFGVAIFFVLSGFVLAASLTRKPAPLAELAARRWFRLSGPVLLTTVPIWLWLTTGWRPDAAMSAANRSEWLAMNYSWLAWQANDLWLAIYQALIDIYIRDNHWWNTSLWTIRIELWGSLVLFAAYRAALRWSVPRPVRLAIALVAAALTWRTDYVGFAVGAALFELQPVFGAGRLASRPPVAGAMGVLLFVSAVLLGGTPVWWPSWTPYAPVALWIGHATADPLGAMHRAGAVLMVAAVLVWPPLQRLLTTRVLGFLGEVSFMVYLCHVVLICTVASWLVLWLTPSLGYLGACAATLPVLLAVVLAVAKLGTVWIDRPCIALANRFGRAVTSLGRRKPRAIPRMLQIPPRSP